MSYSIRYSPHQTAKYQKKEKLRLRRFFLAVIILAACLTPIAVFRNEILDMITPGNPEVTRRAAQNMVEALREGESVNDAVTAFCLEVIRDGLQDPD